MIYLRPILTTVKMSQICKNQESGFLICPGVDFIPSIDCDCTCPEVALSPCNPVADGNDVAAQITITLSAGTCQATFQSINPNDVNQNRIENGVLYLSCAASNYTCNDGGTCDIGQKGQSGEACVTSLTVNGDVMEGFPVCVPIDNFFVDRAIDACIAINA